MILFYDHLVNKTDINIYIDKLEAPDNHKGRLRQLVDDILHQGLVEYILQKLHPHQHSRFLDHLHTTPYDPELISYLKDHLGPDAEKQLKDEAIRLVALIKKDLKI